MLDTLLLRGNQEVGCVSVGGFDTMKCSWCDGLAISGFVGYLIDDA